MRKKIPTKKGILFFLFLSAFNLGFAQKIIPVDSAGMRLQRFYLAENVENLWLAGQHVNWETGVPDKPYATKSIKTHCSSFVASVCKQKGIYILRPPAHKTELLASAQYDWLFSTDAFKQGWRQIKDSIYKKAQQLANRGYIVTAVYSNPNPKKPGHIALVMPYEKEMDSLDEEGPTLIQAGATNKNFISLKDGFKHHISDWNTATQDIALFYNVNGK
jgi:hypothetical protein